MIRISKLTTGLSSFGLGLVIAASSLAEPPVKYFILAGTMEPLMILEPDDPMAGGMFTEIVEQIFHGSPYRLEPEVMPWRRMEVELRQRDDWIMHGVPAFFEPDIPYELTQTPVFPFNHIAVSMKSKALDVRAAEDLFGKTVILVENYHYPGLDQHLDQPVAGSGDGRIKSVRAFKPDETLKMLRYGRGDVVIGFEPRLLYHLAAAGLTYDDIEIHDASIIIETEPMFVAYSPDHPDDFKTFLNDRLSEMAANGALETITRKYYAPHQP